MFQGILLHLLHFLRLSSIYWEQLGNAIAHLGVENH
jgi:hypothetical protein